MKTTTTISNENTQEKMANANLETILYFLQKAQVYIANIENLSPIEQKMVRKLIGNYRIEFNKNGEMIITDEEKLKELDRLIQEITKNPGDYPTLTGHDGKAIAMIVGGMVLAATFLIATITLVALAPFTFGVTLVPAVVFSLSAALLFKVALGVSAALVATGLSITAVGYFSARPVPYQEEIRESKKTRNPLRLFPQFYREQQEAQNASKLSVVVHSQSR